MSGVKLPVSCSPNSKGAAMLLPKQQKAYCDFYDAVRDGEMLDRRTTVIVGLTTAMAIGCDP
jgi:hypothetical protein